MKDTNESTTMICLFHAPEQAQAAVKDLVEAGIPKSSIGVMGNANSAEANPVAMEKWKVPERDARLLTEGINRGGVVVAVAAAGSMADRVESIFGRHQASQIDETMARTAQPAPAARPEKSAENVSGKIDIVEEQMVVGKREIQSGGVRVYQRVIETPVSETISLREEHVTVDRHPVDRAVTAEDLDGFRDQAFEITERGEEAVVSKTARVVEEVVLGKETTEHKETVKGTVRKTDVTIEKLEPEKVNGKPVRA